MGLFDVYWYMVLAEQMEKSLERDEGLITVDNSADREWNTKSCYVELHSHPVGMNGQNHITAITPLQFFPAEMFQKRQKSITPNRKMAIMSAMMNAQSNIIDKKIEAKKMKEKGNLAFKRKRFDEAEKCYSEAIELNIGYRPLWTNRAS